MSKKDMSDKLLGAVRAAKTQSGATPAAQPKPAHPLPGGGGVHPSVPTPVPSLDDPWGNLHPERIWPD